MDVAIHETGHSLDLLGAYGEQLSGMGPFTEIKVSNPSLTS